VRLIVTFGGEHTKVLRGGYGVYEEPDSIGFQAIPFFSWFNSATTSRRKTMRLHVKNRFWINTALSSMFAALVMACGGGGTTTPTVSSVLVSGPTAATLKINEGTAFTAIAKDSSGAAVIGKAFTWTSSDTNIATVDTGGIVTAKRIGTVKISAITESINGESAVQTTYGLEMAGGVFKNLSLTGTSFIGKFRLADGSAPQVVINVSGPDGWNSGGSPVNLTLSPTTWGIGHFWDGTIGAIAGTYQATTTVNASNYATTFEINPGNNIALATGITVSNATKTQADVSWTAPTGASGYVATIWLDNPSPTADTIVPGANTRTVNTSLQFRGITLDPAKQYYVIVKATNAAWSPDNPPIPSQFNLSIALTASNFSPAP
jgi:Bacterial Ig-like domain (group 2)